MSKLLIVDDEPSLREFLGILFRKSKHEIVLASNGQEAVSILKEQEFDAIFTDLKMPGGIGGLEVLEYAKKVAPSTQVVVMTAFATTDTAIKAMKLGAYDYIQKPFQIDEIQVILTKCLEKRALLQENVQLKSQIQSRYNFGNIIGKSQQMKSIFELLNKVAHTKVNVLIMGYSGTGKELVAKALHYNSPRKDQPFIAINCGAIPEQLLESELFGHAKGAFTGAERNKPGLFQTADGGTLFLDEIGELPLHTQVKLLRALQDKTVRPLGTSESIPVDVRIVAATNRRLDQMVKEGTFREDLYFRLNVLTIELPPLRKRRDDIPLLVEHFLQKYTKEMGRDIQGISREALDILSFHDYPGNVRELENIIERAVLLESGSVIKPESLPPQVRGASEPFLLIQTQDLQLPEEGLEAFIEKIEHQLLLLALKQSKGVRKTAAKLLKISSRSFRYRLAKHKIHVEHEEES